MKVLPAPLAPPENAEVQANAPVKPGFNNIRDMFDDDDDVVEISDDDDQISVKDNLGSYVDNKNDRSA